MKESKFNHLIELALLLIITACSKTDVPTAAGLSFKMNSFLFWRDCSTDEMPTTPPRAQYLSNGGIKIAAVNTFAGVPQFITITLGRPDFTGDTMTIADEDNVAFLTLAEREYYVTTDSCSGWCRITNYDKQNGRISGEFSFDAAYAVSTFFPAEYDYSKIIKITKGSFRDLHITN